MQTTLKLIATRLVKSMMLSSKWQKTKHVTEAHALAKKIKSFQFLVMLVIWYDLLMQIHLARKILQTPYANLDEAVICRRQISFFATLRKLDYRALLSQLKSWQKN